MNGDRVYRRKRLTYHISQLVTFLILKLFFRIRTTGLENIPREGGVIIASNHASLADPPSLGCIIPREVSYFAKQELSRIPVVGQFIAFANGIWVDREGDSAAALKELIRRLKHGWAVIIFPEGTRTKTGEFGEAKSGAGMAAVMARVPVVPCWIEGSFRAKLFRSRITLHFLPPFHPDEISSETKKEHYLLVSRRIMCDIQRFYNTQMAVRNLAKSKER